jgi:hypothetical protein
MDRDDPFTAEITQLSPPMSISFSAIGIAKGGGTLDKLAEAYSVFVGSIGALPDGLRRSDTISTY